MNINKVRSIYFSPTHTSAKIAEEIAKGTGFKLEGTIDLTFPIDGEWHFNNDELVIISAPVYGGRVVPIAVERLKSIHGNSTFCVVISTYGNRDYDDALLELNNLVKEQGLIPIAAGAFIGEHSYSTNKYPIGLNRPDEDDLIKAYDFGKDIAKKIDSIQSIKELTEISIKGNFPYKDYAPTPATPSTDETLCTQCCYCIDICPMECISLEDEIISDINKCIKCCACVKGCPNNARIYITPYSKILNEKCSERKEPEIIL